MNRQSKVMKSERHIEDPDIILIGSGIMSATLGVVLKELDPKLKIRRMPQQKSESQVSARVINRMTGLGIPKSIRVT